MHFLNMSKLVQNQYDTNCYDSLSKMPKLVQNEYDMNCYDSQTCLNLSRINMMQIDTILIHVKTRNENMTKNTKIE
jgi:hypothetical protein